jgi:hypothetical protein
MEPTRLASFSSPRSVAVKQPVAARACLRVLTASAALAPQSRSCPNQRWDLRPALGQPGPGRGHQHDHRVQPVRVPDTCRPDAGRSGSEGRSIRRSLPAVTTSSTLPQAAPAGGGFAAVLGRRPPGTGVARNPQLAAARPRRALPRACPSQQAWWREERGGG